MLSKNQYLVLEQTNNLSGIKDERQCFRWRTSKRTCSQLICHEYGRIAIAVNA